MRSHLSALSVTDEIAEDNVEAACVTALQFDAKIAVVL